MVGNSKYEKVYNLFYPSHQKSFIERSVQFKQELMKEVELVEGDCSHPPLNNDVSDVSISNFYNYDMEYEDDEINADHNSPIRPKWDEKTMQATGDLVGDPLDSRKTRSQFHNDFSTCDQNIPQRCL